MSLSKASGELSLTKVLISLGVGGRPVRSNVARRMSVRLSVGGEKLRPLAFSLRRRKASMGFFVSFGTGGFLIDWNSQKLRSSSVTSTESGSSGSGREVLAPCAIHSLIRAMSSLASLACPLGILPLRIFCRSRLLLGCPATMAGPCSPPSRIRCRNRRSRSPLNLLSSPWH